MLAIYVRQSSLWPRRGDARCVQHRTFRSWRRRMFSAILRFALMCLVSAVYRQSLLWLRRCSLSSTLNRLLRSWRRQTVELFEWLAGSACRRPSRLYCMAIIVLPNHIQLPVKIYNCDFLVERRCDASVLLGCTCCFQAGCVQVAMLLVASVLLACTCVVWVSVLASACAGFI